MMEMKSLTRRNGLVCGSTGSGSGKRTERGISAGKKWTPLTLLLLGGLLLLGFSAPALKPAISFSSTQNFLPLTTYHNITVDANLSDWHTDENLTGKDNANWYFTWNGSSLFVGLFRGETFHGATDDYDVLWVYLDTAPGGATTSVDWNGQHTLPFAADWCFVFKPRPYGDTNYYWNLRHWNGSGWQIDMPYTGNGGYPAWHWDNGTAEIEIPFADIGNPSAVKVVLFLTNGANNWLFGPTPTQNPTGPSPQALTAYWNYTALNSGVGPNNPSNIVPEFPLALFAMFGAGIAIVLERVRK
ncbi:MAG: hypothetical protein N3F63_02210 [Thermoplasmata archaeon]|nr:hypothetical protein [Thermoplasmata archaeon]